MTINSNYYFIQSNWNTLDDLTNPLYLDYADWGYPDPVSVETKQQEETSHDDVMASVLSVSGRLLSPSPPSIPMQTTKPPRPWSKVEIEKLKELRKIHGPDWVTIAPLMDRSPNQCSHKWREDIWPHMSQEERSGYEVILYKHWTQEENVQLMKLVGIYGIDWIVIASFLNRTPYACQSHWNNYIFPQIPEEEKHKYSRLWSKMEIQKLKELRKLHGPDWITISSQMGRTPKQCSSKWSAMWSKMSEEEKSEYEEYNVASGRWSDEEDTLLMDLVKDYGTDWVNIAPFFLNRTQIACKNRWNRIILPQIHEDDIHNYTYNIRWTNEKTKIFLELVSKYGKDWHKISSQIGKSVQQCQSKLRYINSSSSVQTKEKLTEIPTPPINIKHLRRRR